MIPSLENSLKIRLQEFAPDSSSQASNMLVSKLGIVMLGNMQNLSVITFYNSIVLLLSLLAFII